MIGSDGTISDNFWASGYFRFRIPRSTRESIEIEIPTLAAIDARVSILFQPRLIRVVFTAPTVFGQKFPLALKPDFLVRIVIGITFFLEFGSFHFGLL